MRLMDNHKNDKGWDADCAYPGVEVLGDGTFGHYAVWTLDRRRDGLRRQRAAHAERT